MTDDLRKDGSAQMTNPSDEKLIKRLEKAIKAAPFKARLVYSGNGLSAEDVIKAAERLRTLAAERDVARDANFANLGAAREAIKENRALQSRLLKAVEVIKALVDLIEDLDETEWHEVEDAKCILQSIEAESGGEGAEQYLRPSREASE